MKTMKKVLVVFVTLAMTMLPLTVYAADKTRDTAMFIMQGVEKYNVYLASGEGQDTALNVLASSVAEYLISVPQSDDIGAEEVKNLVQDGVSIDNDAAALIDELLGYWSAGDYDSLIRYAPAGTAVPENTGEPTADLSVWDGVWVNDENTLVIINSGQTMYFDSAEGFETQISAQEVSVSSISATVDRIGYTDGAVDDLIYQHTFTLTLSGDTLLLEHVFIMTEAQTANDSGTYVRTGEDAYDAYENMLKSAPNEPATVNPTPTQPTAPVTTESVGTVNPTPSKVLVNGVEQSFEAYNIKDQNYFKLRDIAFVLNGTNKQFDVGYDNTTKAITMTSNTPYTVAGGEMVPGNGQPKPATPTASMIYLDGQQLNFTVYTIAGNNFFKLVDLMSVLNIGVTYNETTMNISIDTNAGYTGVVTVTEPIEESVAAQVAEPAPDGNIPYDLRWVDFENGIISFATPLSDDEVRELGYVYRIGLYHNGDALAIGSATYSNENPKVEDISYMFEEVKGDTSGEYVFEVILYDTNIQEPIGKAVSAPYILD